MKMMHRIKFASLLALLIALPGALCVPSRTDAACTAATIGNTYGFHFDGFAGAPGAPTALKVSAFVPAAGVGEISFTPTSDTGSTISGSESLDFGGLQFQVTFTGTYTVNTPKCTGSLTAAFQDGGHPYTRHCNRQGWRRDRIPANRRGRNAGRHEEGVKLIRFGRVPRCDDVNWLSIAEGG
jgi:hypothetical protein